MESTHLLLRGSIVWNGLQGLWSLKSLVPEALYATARTRKNRQGRSVFRPQVKFRRNPKPLDEDKCAA
jgi:hypothetical protein